jgi:3-dehydroquinate dehydratase I
MRPRICASIAKETSAEVSEAIHSLELSSIDLIEIRADYLRDWGGIQKIPVSVNIPTVFTYKNTRQSQDGYGEEFRERLKAAERFTYIDFDLSTRGLKEQVAALRDQGIKPIISYHNDSNTPSLTTLRKIIQKESDAGAEICKLVTTAKRPEDNLTCLRLVKELSGRHKIVCFTMGYLGTPSRVMSPIFGAFFTFASIYVGEETAQGQLTVKEMREIYKILGVDDW